MSEPEPTEPEPTEPPATTVELLSAVTDDGRVTLSLSETAVPAPAEDEVVVRIEACPINPSDLGMLFAGADLQTLESTGTGEAPAVAATLSPTALAAQAARVGTPMPAGNEGGGTVVAAGSSEAAQALVGKVVGFRSGNAYAGHRTIPAADCIAMPGGTDPAVAAAPFVNPLTALGMVETMKAEGHTALAHTVGASNLGLMLNRICLADGIGLVNVVRRPEHVAKLRELGAEHVCDSSADSYLDDLTGALRATGATIAFDAVGGGDGASTLLSCMEQVAAEGAGFSRYGSNTHKQVYIYGGLDRGPTVLNRSFGMRWSVGGWLLPPFLAGIGPEGVARLQRRVADEISTTFASSYGMELSLADVVEVGQARRYGRMTSGDKALVRPQR